MMKKTLLLCAVALCSLVAKAGDGLLAVGANVIVLPSTQYDGDIEWKAWTWVYNSGVAYGDWNTDNPNYNMVFGAPSDDAEGRKWYEPGYDMGPKYDLDNLTGDINWDTNEPIVWEEHTAPFSSDETYNGRRSYQWTTFDIMADIYVRRTFTTDQLLSGPVYLACGHDDAPCEYYINGELVFSRDGYETDENGNILNGWNNGEYILLTDEQKALIKLNGEENVIAFYVHQNWGGAFADCGIYTRLEGGLDMGYTTPWEGKVLFNNIGGYNFDGQSPSNNPKHPWSKLYEAQEGDEYTFMLPGSVTEDVWMERLQFKTPIKIEEGRTYNFKATFQADKPFEAFILKLSDNDDDAIELAYEEMTIDAPVEGEEYEGTTVNIDFEGQPGVNNFMIDLDFGGGQDSTTVTIKDISLVDVTETGDEKELWVGTHYFNYIAMHKTTIKYMVWDDTLNDGMGDYREAKTEEEKEYADIETHFEEINAPEISGRTETLAWTLPDFDDSMWDDQMMPVGEAGYMAEVQSIWPGGENTNYWIRRNFELDKVNERLSYELNVCHDDVYETYVNGHLLQKNVGWTNGKNPVQVHIPARYLNVGKNVIATYIQQNWGGKFYDCGINVTEVNFDECYQMLVDAIEYAKTDTLLTNAMKDSIQAIIDAANYELANNKDAAELRNYARELRPRVNAIFAYSGTVKTLMDTYAICRKMQDKGYWGTALTDVAAALDTCATANELNPYIDRLRDARKATAMERRTENFKGSVPVVAGPEYLGDYMSSDEELPKYYLYNVGAKLLLGAGEAYGTHLALVYESNPMLLVQSIKENYDEETGEFIDEEVVEGAVRIETFRPNGAYGEADFVGWNGFIDAVCTDAWEIIPVEGKENVFNIAQYGQTFATDTVTTEEGEQIVTGGGKKYLGLRSGDNQYAPSYYLVDTDMHTPELETNQWMFISRAEMLSFIPNATAEAPADMTFLIKNPGYDQRLSMDDWISLTDGGNVMVNGGDYRVYEAYNSNEFSIYQELWPDEYDVALPVGTYKLSVQAYYRDGIEQDHVNKFLNNEPIAERALLFAGADPTDMASCQTMPLALVTKEANQVPGIGWTSNPGNLRMPGLGGGCEEAGRHYFPCGLYKNDLVFTIEEGNEGHLAIGIYKAYDENNPGSDWVVMDNWRLTYYGNGEIDPDAIRGVESDEIKKVSPASKGIYNMLGQRMSKVQKGLNIVDGKKIIKK